MKRGIDAAWCWWLWFLVPRVPFHCFLTRTAYSSIKCLFWLFCSKSRLNTFLPVHVKVRVTSEEHTISVESDRICCSSVVSVTKSNITKEIHTSNTTTAVPGNAVHTSTADLITLWLQKEEIKHHLPFDQMATLPWQPVSLRGKDLWRCDWYSLLTSIILVSIFTRQISCRPAKCSDLRLYLRETLRGFVQDLIHFFHNFHVVLWQERSFKQIKDKQLLTYIDKSVSVVSYSLW